MGSFHLPAHSVWYDDCRHHVDGYRFADARVVVADHAALHEGKTAVREVSRPAGRPDSRAVIFEQAVRDLQRRLIGPNIGADNCPRRRVPHHAVSQPGGGAPVDPDAHPAVSERQVPQHGAGRYR